MVLESEAGALLGGRVTHRNILILALGGYDHEIAAEYRVDDETFFAVSLMLGVHRYNHFKFELSYF